MHAMRLNDLLHFSDRKELRERLERQKERQQELSAKGRYVGRGGEWQKR